MVRKMILVPAEMSGALHNTPRNPAINQLTALDQEMKSILEDHTIPADEKMARYYSALNQYEVLHENARQVPIPVTLHKPKTAQGDSSISASLPAQEEHLLDIIPKRNRQNASLLLKFIKQNPHIAWHQPTKELVYKGAVIPGSNVYSLVNDFSRQLKAASPPPGWQELAIALSQQNVPKEAIGNSSRWNFIADKMQQSPGTPANQNPDEIYETPKTHGKRKLRFQPLQRGRGRYWKRM